jgi:predicted nucleotidyltransferase
MGEYDALLGRSRIRRDLLRLLFENPLPRLHLRELARSVRTSAGTAARELARLEEAGLVSRTSEGAQVYFQPNTASPLYPTVRDLVRLTIGASDVLRRELAGIAGVKSAVIFGSYASGTMQPTSDIDVLVIGEPDRDDLTERLERAARDVGRSVNEVVMSEGEAATRRAASDGLLLDIDSRATIDLLP